MIVKECTKCEKEFPATTEHFYKTSDKRKDGTTRLFSTCKECHKKAQEKYRKTHPEIIRRIYRNYYQEDIKARKRKYYQEALLKKDKAYWDLKKEYNRKYKQAHVNIPNTDPSITKKCSKCEEFFPATIEFFYKGVHGKHGLRGRCLNCAREINRVRACLAREKKRLETLPLMI